MQSDKELPSDEAFLESLYVVPLKARSFDPSFVAWAVKALRTSSDLPRPGVDADQYVKDLFDPVASFRGRVPILLKQMVRPYLRVHEEHLLAMPIGFLHTEQLNACAVLAPSGGKVIVMDIGIELYMTKVMQCVLVLNTWCSPQPFCRDHELSAWVDTIISLARYAHANDDRFLTAITTWVCPSIGDLDLTSGKYATQVELFVLLHEFGHVVLGHLDAQMVDEISGLHVFSTNHEQEFEADAFAFNRQTAVGHEVAAAISAGILFRFLDLVEHVKYGAPMGSKTHPPARERLARLKALESLTDTGRQAIQEAEYIFDMILDIYGNPKQWGLTRVQ